MFDRKKYKSFARIQLKNRRTVPVFMTLITALVVLLLSLPLIKLWLAMYSELLNAAAAQSSRYVLQKIISNYQKEIERIAFLPWLVFFTIAVCAIAQFCVYLKMSRTPNPVSFGDFFAGFAHWFRAIRAALWCWLWTYLWMLLFVIPGIVKAIAYSQTFFIVAENPHISVRKAMRLSIAMTKGYKGDLFVLGLSFIGWALVSTLTLYIGYLWLMPYINVTRVNAYRFLKQSAFDRGVLKPEDFGTSGFIGNV